MRWLPLLVMLLACEDPLGPWVVRDLPLCIAALNEDGIPVDRCGRERCEYRGTEVRNCVWTPL